MVSPLPTAFAAQVELVKANLALTAKGLTGATDAAVVAAVNTVWDRHRHEVVSVPSALTILSEVVAELTPPPIETLEAKEEPVDPEVLFDLLTLVWNEFPVSVALVTVEGWSERTRREVAEWVSAVHLCASDNDVDIPPRPRVLEGESE
jgi:hypothetical protein